MSAPPGFYVYGHFTPAGELFYVGKGTGYRAWARGRHSVWHYYVTKRLGGAFNVSILKDGLDEDTAVDLEEQLIAEYGDRLVNWINPGRGFNYKALDQYWQLKNAAKALIARTRPIEASDPEAAIAAYREALRIGDEWNTVDCSESGLVGEINSEMGDDYESGCTDALDRLTVVLRKQGRLGEVIDEIDRYSARYPGAMSCRNPVVKRRESVARTLAKQFSVPNHAQGGMMGGEGHSER